MGTVAGRGGTLGAHAARTGTVLDLRLLEAFRLRWDLADVDFCVRDLRATGARRHVREEIPFFTGPRVPLAELVAALP